MDDASVISVREKLLATFSIKPILYSYIIGNYPVLEQEDILVQITRKVPYIELSEQICV